MSAVAYISFAGFYTAALARKQPELCAVAVLKNRLVLDSNAKARLLGIVPGIAASEAKYASRGEQVRFVDYKDEDYNEFASVWLDVCAEYTSAIEPVEPHCAYLDLQGLPSPHELAEPLAADIYSAIRLCPQVGVAGSKLLARVAGKALQPCQEARFLAALPIESLWPVASEHRQRLRFLGYRTVGEVAALPLSLLKKQFGEQGLQISRLAKGMDESAVRPLYPPEVIAAKFYFPQPAKNDAEIETALQCLANELAFKLTSRGVQTRNIEITTIFEKCERIGVRTFNRPMRNSGALLTGIRLTLRQITLREDVVALFVRCIHEPASDTQYAMEADKASADVAPAIDRLKETFGAGSVYAASEVVIPRRRILLRSYEGDT